MRGDPLEQRRFFDQPEIHDDIGQRFTGGFMLRVEFVELRGLDEFLVSQKLVNRGAVRGKHFGVMDG